MENQGHSHFDREYFVNCDRYGRHYYRHQMARLGFRLAYLHLALTHSKGYSKVKIISIANISYMVTDMENIALVIKYEVASLLSINIII